MQCCTNIPLNVYVLHMQVINDFTFYVKFVLSLAIQLGSDLRTEIWAQD
jgi:hypothetical protein